MADTKIANPEDKNHSTNLCIACKKSVVTRCNLSKAKCPHDKYHCRMQGDNRGVGAQIQYVEYMHAGCKFPH